MDRALQANILAKSGRAVETAGDIDTVLLDKTGTITVGARHATRFVPVGKYAVSQLARLAALASVADETPEGKSIVRLAREMDGLAAAATPPRDAQFVAFSAQTRMSGVDLPDGTRIRKGAPDAIVSFVRAQQGTLPQRLEAVITEVASRGATPLLVAEGASIAGLVVLEDILKAGIGSGRWGSAP